VFRVHGLIRPWRRRDGRIALSPSFAKFPACSPPKKTASLPTQQRAISTGPRAQSPVEKQPSGPLALRQTKKTPKGRLNVLRHACATLDLAIGHLGYAPPGSPAGSSASPLSHVGVAASLGHKKIAVPPQRMQKIAAFVVVGAGA